MIFFLSMIRPPSLSHEAGVAPKWRGLNHRLFFNFLSLRVAFTVRHVAGLEALQDVLLDVDREEALPEHLLEVRHCPRPG